LNNTTVSKGGIATSVVVAVVTVMSWVLYTGWHVVVPDAIQGSLIVILTPLLHTVAVRYGIDSSPPEAPPAARSEPHLAGPNPLNRAS
jgi:hypothetical protein